MPFIEKTIHLIVCKSKYSEIMKILNIFTIILVSLTLTLQVSAQQRNCGVMEHLEHEISLNPERATKLEAIERHTQDWIDNGTSLRETITIPVVVHVVYRTSTENISDAQIQSQINILNEDFRRLNSDADNTWSQAADSEIEFCLASVDPNGNATNGITRTSTTVNGFGTNDRVKSSAQGGKDAWPASDYLNFWVCNIGGGILGYAQFPGGSAATDGVVNGYQYTGNIGTAQAPFNLGRTATHEVGHWLNLRHIWGDGNCNQDDFVSDTPSSDNPNYGCATGHVSCSSVDMVQNYMDYSDDGCMNLFTQGQKARMQALFVPGGARASLLNSNGCGQGTTPTCSDGVQNGNETGVDCGGSCEPCQSSCSDNALTFSLTTDNYGSETTWSLTNASGSVIASGGPYANNTTYTVDICAPDACYDFQINDSYGDGICCAYGNGSYNLSGASGTLASGGSFTSSETTNFCLGSTPPGPSCTDGIQNGNETGVDCGGDCADCPPTSTCDSPTGTYVQLLNNSTRVRVYWDEMSGADRYGIQYRAVGASSWTSYTTAKTNRRLSGLSTGTTYEYQLRSRCSGTWGDYSSSYTFNTNNRLAQLEEEFTMIEITALFPNPAQDVLNIAYDVPVDGTISIEVYDVLGRKVLDESRIHNAGEQELRLNIANLEAGYHLLRIQKGGEQVIKKFVKQ